MAGSDLFLKAGFYHDSARDRAGPDVNLRDLDNDGWIDVVVLDRHESPNLETRALLRFRGVSHATLIGARVEAREPGTQRLLGTRAIAVDQSYKSSGALDAHFGLARVSHVDVRVIMPDGHTARFTRLASDRAHDLDLAAP